LDKIKAIIFDVDETLVDRKKAFLCFCEYLIDTYAKEYPFQGTAEELITYMVEIDENGYAGLKKFLTNLKKRWQLPHSLERFITERNDVFGKMAIPYPEMFEVLEILKGKYKLGIITNGYSQVQRDKIEQVKIAHYFDDIIVSGEVEFEKPDSRIFKLACDNLGVSNKEAVFIGDYYPNDIAGAIGAKIMPIWINNNPNEHPEYMGIRVQRLKDILSYLG
jgi:putative hydrolase of the HAD superfamily